MNIKKLLGAKISRLRKEKGFSQIHFAEKLGISTNALSLIETGNGFCTAETLEKILLTLEVEPNELFSFGGICSTDEIYNRVVEKIQLLKNNREKLKIINIILDEIL